MAYSIRAPSIARKAFPPTHSHLAFRRSSTIARSTTPFTLSIPHSRGVIERNRNTFQDVQETKHPQLSQYPKIHRATYSSTPVVLSNSEMPHSSAASRLNAIKNHVEPEPTYNNNNNNNNNNDNTTQQVAPRDLDFSTFPALLPNEANAANDTSLWYIVTAAALLAFHQEPAVGQLWKYINGLNNGNQDEKAVKVARRIRETCLKSSVLVGFPRGINGLSSLHSSIEKTLPSVHKILNNDTSLRSPISPETKLKRGKHFFSQIYANHTDRILQSMGNSSGGDLSYFALSSVYGELMAETSILNPMETVMLEFVCCLADDVAPQAKGHFFGCRNLGATGDQVKGAVAIVQDIARQLGLNIPGNGGGYGFLAKADTW